MCARACLWWHDDDDDDDEVEGTLGFNGRDDDYIAPTAMAAAAGSSSTQSLSHRRSRYEAGRLAASCECDDDATARWTRGATFSSTTMTSTSPRRRYRA